MLACQEPTSPFKFQAQTTSIGLSIRIFLLIKSQKKKKKCYLFYYYYYLVQVEQSFALSEIINL